MNAPIVPSLDQLRAHDDLCEEAIGAAHAFGQLLARMGLHDESMVALAAGLEIKKLRRPEIAERMDTERLHRARSA